MTTSAIDLGWSLEDVASELDGVVVGGSDVAITSVSIDSRDIAQGALFVAIDGENFDGHNFAAAAIDAGAAAAVVEAGRCTDVVPRIEVAGTLDALKALGVKRRNELEIPVVAITGSTGKTSTKDLISAGISGSWASPRSFNNEIGVPLTVLSTPNNATVLVLEVGSRGSGHINWLAPLVRPDIAVVTNLGVVHLETFGSEEGLADAKYELIEALAGTGTAIVPSDEPRLRRPTDNQVITFGTSPANVTVVDASVGLDGSTTFAVEIAGVRFERALAMSGVHQAYNAAAAVAVCSALGMDVGMFLDRMQTTTGSEWRMDVHEGTFTVVNDAYNANPQSVASALETVAAMAGRSFAIVGPMAELGSVCEQQHTLMGALATELGFEQLIVVGPDHGYGLGAPDIAVYATDTDTARDTLLASLDPGDVVLVKASRSSGLERLADQLIKEATQ